MDKAIEEILDGIDKTEIEYENGWWETSTGAEFGAKTKQELQALIDSAKREELEQYVKYVENTSNFYPLYASLDRERAIDDCRRFAANYGKHRIAQLEQSEESI